MAPRRGRRSSPLADLTPAQSQAVVRLALQVHCRNDPARVEAVADVLFNRVSVRRAAADRQLGRRAVSRLVATFRDTIERAHGEVADA